MKNLKTAIFFASLVMLTCFGLFAQAGSGFGLKAGFNYGGNGDYFESISDNVQNPEANIGYHIGIFGKIGNQLYLRPELMYTKTNSEYSSGDFDMSKIDLPVLVGIKVIGPLSVFAGPSFQYILNSEFDGIDIDDIENDFSVGLHFGIGVNFNNIGLDLRYERGFSENEATFLANNNVVSNDRIDVRPEQLILSLSIKI